MIKRLFNNWVYDRGLRFIPDDETEGCPSHVFELEVQTLQPKVQRIQVDASPEVQKLWAELRDHPSLRIAHFGAVGDSAHQKRKSCHNIVKNSNGVVIEKAKALDIHPVGFQPKVSSVRQAAAYRQEGDNIARYLIQNRARLGITLVIWYGRKASAKSGWKWVPYTGISPHTDHVHASVNC